MAGFVISSIWWICDAVADWLRVGVGISRTTSDTYAAIEVRFKNEDLPQVKAILEEMSRRGEFPQVYLTETDGLSTVVVLFILHGNLDPLISKLLPQLPLPQLPAETKLWLAGEADVTWEDRRKFHEWRERKGCYKLFLLDENDRPFWSAQLTKISNEYPSFDGH